MDRIRGFDGLRALAAGSVVVAHLGLHRGLPDAVAATIGGTAAVQLFFALSGFLITTLLVREQRAFGRVSVRFFYLRRVFRIMPLYFLCIGATVALQAVAGRVSDGRTLAYALTYTYNLLPWRHGDAQLEHVWSLAVEEHFYLVWPLLFAALYPRRKRTLVGASVLACLLSVLVHERLPAGFGRGYTVGRWTCFAGTSILFGCVAAVVSCDPDYAPRWPRRLRSRWALAAGLVLWANAFVLAFSPASYHLRGAGFALLVAWLYHRQEGRAVRVLDVGPLRYLGAISYGIYMFQGVLLTTRPERVAGQAWPPPPWLGFALLAVLAPLSYRFLERPLMRFGGRYRQGAGGFVVRGTAPPAATAPRGRVGARTAPTSTT